MDAPGADQEWNYQNMEKASDNAIMGSVYHFLGFQQLTIRWQWRCASVPQKFCINQFLKNLCRERA